MREPSFSYRPPSGTGPVQAVADDVRAAGSFAEAAEVDALDEQAVAAHLQSVIEQADRVDISLNAVGIPEAKILGVPLVELDVDQFCLPIALGSRKPGGIRGHRPNSCLSWEHDRLVHIRDFYFVPYLGAEARFSAG